MTSMGNRAPKATVHIEYGQICVDHELNDQRVFVILFYEGDKHESHLFDHDHKVCPRLPESQDSKLRRVLVNIFQRMEGGSNKFINVGIQDLTPGLSDKNALMRNTHLHLNVCLKVDDNVPCAKASKNVNSVLSRLDKAHGNYMGALQKALSGRHPQMDSGISYTEDFASKAHLFYAPSEFLTKEGDQVAMSPLLHFRQHRTHAPAFLDDLAKLAVAFCADTHGMPLTLEKLQDPETPKALRSKVFVRYLAMLGNLVTYESDYDFKIRYKDCTTKSKQIADLFSDSLMSMTGDCEDASRVVMDVWRSTEQAPMENRHHKALALMKDTQSHYNFYATLCTIRASCNMAHATCMVTPKNTNEKDDYPFSIVEGTNAISFPAGISGVGTALAQFYDDPYTKGALAMAPKAISDEEARISKMIKDGTVLCARPKSLLVTQISEGDATPEGQTSAGGGHEWYGYLNEFFQPEFDGSCRAFLGTPKSDPKKYGVTPEQLERGDAVLMPIKTPKESTPHDEYVELVKWKNEWMNFTRCPAHEMKLQMKVPALPQSPCLPLLSYGEPVEKKSESDCSFDWLAVLDYVPVEPQEPINGKPKVSARIDMGIHSQIMNKFGAAVQGRKLYPSGADASIVAAMAHDYHCKTGSRLILKPHVDIGTIIQQAQEITEPKAAAKVSEESTKSQEITEPENATIGCSGSHTGMRYMGRGKSRKGSHKMGNHHMTPMGEHAIESHCGNLITAFKAMKVGTPNTNIDSKYTSLKYELNKTSPENHNQVFFTYAQEHPKEPLSKFIQKSKAVFDKVKNDVDKSKIHTVMMNLYNNIKNNTTFDNIDKIYKKAEKDLRTLKNEIEKNIKSAAATDQRYDENEAQMEGRKQIMKNF